MMKKLGAVLLVLTLLGAFAIPQSAVAQNGNGNNSGQVTHPELANILVNLLGLARFLPADPTEQESFTVLLQNEISPPNGWDVEGVVTKGDLSVVLVKALKQLGEDVDFDTDDAAQCLEFLRSRNIPMDTIGEGVSILEPIPNPVSPEVFDPTSDPLDIRQKVSPLDEQEFGADATFQARPAVLAQIQAIIQDIIRPESPVVVLTPFQP